MSLDAQVQDSPVVDTVAPLIDWLRAGEKPAERHRCGLETEKVAVVAATGAPAPLTGDRSMAELVRRLAVETGGRLLIESDTPVGIALGDASVAFEPGGQLELSGAPFTSLAPMEAELADHLKAVRRIGAELGLAFLSTGYRPFGPRDAVPWLPRGRYALMRQRLPGHRAHDMMQMTASVQANFDFADEADLARKVSVATAVSPVIAALFANAPLVDGRPSGRQSERYGLWTQVDASRSGLLRVMFEPGFTYERYVDWALAVPLLFVRRQGRYVDPEGRTFRDLMQTGLLGQPATMQDYVDLLSTLFPEIRVKRVVEVRGADAVDERQTMALPAIWTALLYDTEAGRAARALIDVPFDDLVRFQADVAVTGMQARLGRWTARELARELLAIADAALARRAVHGADERRFLVPLHEVVTSGRTPADRALSAWTSCGGDVPALIDALRL